MANEDRIEIAPPLGGGNTAPFSGGETLPDVELTNEDIALGVEDYDAEAEEELHRDGLLIIDEHFVIERRWNGSERWEYYQLSNGEGAPAAYKEAQVQHLNLDCRIRLVLVTKTLIAEEV